MSSPPEPGRNRTVIRPLSERLINKIAAGEVVERPAAVVKELVENAIDSGATQIDITIEKSGTKSIRIVDNGCGIRGEQIEIAFSRHATSKISEFKDLDRVMSYGFRGEALPSIASVSHMRMVSRPREAEVGHEIIFEGGVLQSNLPLAAAAGTTVEVGNLFFNTPARRKFLKSESTEARQIARIATALAIGKPHVGFSFKMNGRNVFSVPPDQELGARVTGLLGPGRKFLAVGGEHGALKVEGHIGLPDMLQSNRYGQYLFLNGRYIQSPSLAHAFVAGYGEMIPRGKFPVGALLLTVDPEDVDVNVHPAKTEVRLSGERAIYKVIYHLINEALRQDGIIPSFRRTESSSPSGNYQPDPQRPSNFIPGVNQQTSRQEYLRDLYDPPGAAEALTGNDIVRVDRSTGEIVDDSAPAGPPPLSGATESDITPSEDIISRLRLVGRFSDLYLLFQADDDLFIIDQHTAHERVLYEETLEQVDKQAVVGQQLLLPVQIELTPEQPALFDEVSELLNSSGFVISHFGGRMVNIEAVPAVMGRRGPEKTVMNVLDDLASLRKGGFDIRKAMAQSIACRAAVMAGDRLSDEEAIGLIKLLLKCENRYTCPHGRPTFVRISRDDIDRQFGRG